MEAINVLLGNLVGIIWGPYFLIPLLVGTGIFLTIRLKIVQVRGLVHAVRVVMGHYDDPDDPGEVNHFRALSAALSATIGTGNIVGVSAAILLGGPGAVFWMWVTGAVGMATKFASCMLAVRYRTIDEQGEVHSGPMHFIEQGLGPRFKWLALAFAFFAATASFGVGNMFQIHNIVGAFHMLAGNTNPDTFYWTNLTIGLVTAGLVAMVIIGGIKRIAVVAGFLVPFMCVFYIGGGVIILFKNMHLIPEGLRLIFYHAFHAPEAITGGLMGAVIRQGVARGLFSNEAGLGSAAIAHGAAKTKEPVREGLVAMLGPLIDTLIVCSITALVVVCTKTYVGFDNASQLTATAFEKGMPGFGWIVAVGTILFAFSTIIAWSYYGDRGTDYLLGKKYVTPYRWIYIVVVVIGSCLQFDVILNFCDAMNGLMAIPNLIALLLLSPIVVKETKDYFNRQLSE